MKKLLTLLALVALFTSCSIKEDDLKIANLNSVDLGKITGSGAEITLGILFDNASKVNMTVKSIKMSVYDSQDAHVVDIAVKQPFTIYKRSQTNVKVPITAKFSGILGMISVGTKLRNPEKLFVDGQVRFKMGCISHTKKFKKMPLKEILGELDTKFLEDLM